MRHPIFPFHSQALRDRRAHRQHPVEIHVMPMRGEMNPAIAITIAIDEPAQGGEWQVKAIDRMGKKQRITLRRFDGPEIVKLDQKPVWLEKRRAGDLICVMESDWRAREIERSAGRDIIVPGDRAVLDPEIADKRHQEPRGHGVDEWGTALDRVFFAHLDWVEGLRRHRLEPAGKAQ